MEIICTVYPSVEIPLTAPRIFLCFKEFANQDTRATVKFVVDRIYSYMNELEAEYACAIEIRHILFTNDKTDTRHESRALVVFGKNLNP